MCISYSLVNIHILHSTFDVIHQVFVEISIKDSKIPMSLINLCYLGWITLKFWENPPNLIKSTNFIEAISEILGLAHKLTHKNLFSLRFWNTISEILLNFFQDLTTDIGSRAKCSCFHDFMLVLWVHKVIIYAFLCCICKLLNFCVKPVVRHC